MENKAGFTKEPIPMVLVEGGTFFMGSRHGDEDERPVHKVALSSFYIGKYPITQKEWNDANVLDWEPSYFKGENHPVECLTWKVCIDFCNELSRREGLEECYEYRKLRMINRDKVLKSKVLKKINLVQEKEDYIIFFPNRNGYRLPTEAEWEFAARGGVLSKGYLYSGSDDVDEVAWYAKELFEYPVEETIQKYRDKGYEEIKARFYAFTEYVNVKEDFYPTHPVGQKKPNELGIYDMSGNVWEWCWDKDQPYSKHPQFNPVGPARSHYRVYRGGSALEEAKNCRCTVRRSEVDDVFCKEHLGLRVARNA